MCHIILHFDTIKNNFRRILKLATFVSCCASLSLEKVKWQWLSRTCSRSCVQPKKVSGILGRQPLHACTEPRFAQLTPAVRHGPSIMVLATLLTLVYRTETENCFRPNVPKRDNQEERQPPKKVTILEQPKDVYPSLNCHLQSLLCKNS